MKENERSAQGVRGMLIRTLDPDNPLIFRIYSEDRKSYKEYVIAHHDLTVTVDDNYSSFYEGGVDGYSGKIDYPSRFSHRLHDDEGREKVALQHRKEG